MNSFKGLKNMIKFSDVTKVISKDKIILDKINIEINKGEFVYFTGPSGCGKTMILKMIYRDALPTKGKVYINGIDISKFGSRAVAYLRRKIGIIFQDFKLMEKRSVYKNISYALEVIGKKKSEIKERVDDVLKFIDLEDKKNEAVSKLSVGEKQRVAIARAIINNPDILLCDEITANLNFEIKKNIMMLLLKLSETGTTIVFATHDRQLIEIFPQRIIDIDEGVVIND